MLRALLIYLSKAAWARKIVTGWAFAWRSLMARELLVRIASRPSIGVRLDTARELSDASGLMAMMIVVLLIGILVDSFLFGSLGGNTRRSPSTRNSSSRIAP